MNGYVLSGWSLTAAVLGLYGWGVLRRGHRLTRILRVEKGEPTAEQAGASHSGIRHDGGSARPWS